jgi:hypothetical protein
VNMALNGTECENLGFFSWFRIVGVSRKTAGRDDCGHYQ